MRMGLVIFEKVERDNLHIKNTLSTFNYFSKIPRVDIFLRAYHLAVAD